MDNNGTQLDTINHRAYLASLEEKLANIESERLAIEATESVLKRSIASTRELIALESGEVVFSKPDDVIIPKRVFKGMLVMDAIGKYLRMAKTGRTAKEIGDALKQGGFDTKSQFFNANVRTALKRQGESRGIVKRGSTYWLAEWPHAPKESEADKTEHSQPDAIDDIEEMFKGLTAKSGSG